MSCSVERAALAPELLTALEEVVGAGGLLLERADLEGYERGWRYGEGLAAAVVRPRTGAQVAEVLRLAATHDVRVHAIGGNTGLVGASNPDASGEQLVLSLERLSDGIEIDALDRTAVVDAGVTLSALNAAAGAYGLCLPIDLGADPQVGGMVVTNTGGARLLRYGDMGRRVLGLEVALSDGHLIDGLRRLRKDNTGLSLASLFTGTSGAFGVVTRVALELEPVERQAAGALVAASDGEALLALLAHLERTTGGTLTAFEVLGRGALEVTLRRGANLRAPFQGELPRYAALIECASSLSPERLDLEGLLLAELEAFCETAPEADGIEDVMLGRPEDFWAIRHQVSECLAQEGDVLALDISVPRSQLPAFSKAARALVAARAADVAVCDFGHWGDGGTHFNLVLPAQAEPSLRSELQAAIYELCCLEFGGSFSAEHGIGPHNAEHHARFREPVLAEAERALRACFDPRGGFERRG